MNESTGWSASWSVWHEPTSNRCSLSAPSGFAAYVAIQHGVGILPKWRLRSVVDCSTGGPVHPKTRTMKARIDYHCRRVGISPAVVRAESHPREGLVSDWRKR